MKISFKKCLKQRKAWYKTIGSSECPIINNEKVFYTSKGFNHLKYDGSGKARTIRDYHRRLWVLPLSIKVIEKSTSIYEYKQKHLSDHHGHGLWGCLPLCQRLR